MNNESLNIKHLHIEGFWDQYTVDMPFTNDVNILTGNNGAGKTTILDIVYSLLGPNPREDIIRKKYRNAKLTLSNESSISIQRTAGEESIIQYTLYGQSVSHEEFSKHILCMAVSNFDTYLPKLDVIRKLTEENPNIYTEMDMQLTRWISVYNQYMASISRRIETLLAHGEKDMTQISRLYFYSRKMESLVNEFLSGAKVWDITNEGKIQFKLTDQNKIITPEQLSSGEKQLLSLLISTLVQEGQTGIVFWDEPEISLHIAWQQKLIRLLRTLNPNMQLIIATHSPNILYEGWEHRVINVKSTFRHE